MRKLLLLLACFAMLSTHAQRRNSTTASNTSVRTTPPPTNELDSLLAAKVKYRLVGPWRGGRSGAVTGSYKNKNTFYFGATGGGVWKTTDAGNNWKNISVIYPIVNIHR